jgi:phenylpropionate dioxygenase-like ring-hydroxylating dioxygenase large terminal subunit
MWLRNCWQSAGFSSEISHSILARRLLDEPIIMYRTEAGQVVALADRCAHRALPLSLGRLRGDSIQCGYHGMTFDSTGTCVGVPGQDSIPGRAVVKTYPIVERYNVVWIWMGDPELANPSLVPDVHYFDDPEWTPVFGYHHINADYRLLNDNLLDLSHESFVHVETIGNRSVADSPVSARIVDERVVHAYRFMSDCEPPPFYVRAAGFTTNIDRWHLTIYTPPGLCLIENGSMPTGADKSTARERRVINLVTPETATSSHYFWGTARGYDLDDADLSEFIQTQTAETFSQDKVILEAQQRSLGPDPDQAFPVTIKVDSGPILGRRLLASMIAAETQSKMPVLN